MNQRELAEQLGVDPSTLTKSLVRQSPTWKHLDRCAELLQVPRQWLLSGENPPPWAEHYDVIGDTMKPPRMGTLQGSAHVSGAPPPPQLDGDLLEVLKSMRAAQTQTTEVLTELVRRCRALDEAVASLKRLEDLGQASGEGQESKRSVS